MQTDLGELYRQSFRDPQSAARALIASDIPVPARWMALVAAASMAAILSWLALQTAPATVEPDTMLVQALSQPIIFAGIQLVTITLSAALMAGVGRMFGGTGRFEDALLLMVWLQFLMLGLEAVQLIVGLIIPYLSQFLGIGFIMLAFWLMVQFTQALHGFQSSLKVFLGIIATAFVAGFLLSVVVAALGLVPEVPQ